MSSPLRARTPFGAVAPRPPEETVAARPVVAGPAGDGYGPSYPTGRQARPASCISISADWGLRW